MAARLTKRQADNAKTAIKVGLILKKLQDHIDDPASNGLQATQIAAAKILLGKALPDLKATEHSGPAGEAIGVQFIIRG
ncbi:MAG: hypothetical protein KGH65_03785 [Candidatus Micrarchaeota archaeon]|nr:hypothetical protein [Candidatus Micrarchaeota archaeon]